VASVSGISLSNILDFTVFELSTSSSLKYKSAGPSSHSRRAANDKLSNRFKSLVVVSESTPSTSSTLSFSYTISSTSGDVTSDSLSSELTSSIDSGIFNGFLSYYAPIFGASELEDGASAGTFSTDASSSSPSSSDSLKGGIIAIIVVVVVVVVVVTVAVCYSTGIGKMLLSPTVPRSRAQSTVVSNTRQTKTDVELRKENLAPRVDVENPMNDKTDDTNILPDEQKRDVGPSIE